MAAPPPSQDELLALADRALACCDGEAQATARWTHELSAAAAGAQVARGTVVEVAVVRDGRAGAVATADVDEDGLRRAVHGAAELAAAAPGGGPAARLGAAAAGRVHEGYDPAATGLEAAAAAAAIAAGGTLRAAAAKLAVVSSAGVRAFEQRSTAELRVSRVTDGRRLVLSQAAVRLSDLDPQRLAAEADALLAGDPLTVPAGEHPVVLGPWAVAEVLRRAAGAFAGTAAQHGPLGGRFGTRAVAPCINLSDSPRYPATLPRSFDAEGVPVRPVPLVQDGVANRAVHDSTTAAAAGATSTGHAVRPGGLAPPRPEHLVLIGGGAVDPDELAAPIERGLLIAGLAPGDGPTARAEGVRVIRGGRIAEPAASVTVAFDALELLSHAHALTAAQRTVPAPPGAPAWALGATVCPWLRAGAGLHVAG